MIALVVELINGLLAGFREIPAFATGLMILACVLIILAIDALGGEK